MVFYKFNKQGFTLVEMLVAMAIFVIFTSVLLNSYTTIVRSQQEANQYRELYVEARKVFDTLTEELRAGMVDYGSVAVASPRDELDLISKDGKEKVKFKYDFVNGVLKMNDVALNDKVEITDLKFYVSPSFDPYAKENYDKSASQFQPKVTVLAHFKKHISDTRGDFEMDLQTTVSSRVYNHIAHE